MASSAQAVREKEEDLAMKPAELQPRADGLLFSGPVRWFVISSPIWIALLLTVLSRTNPSFNTVVQFITSSPLR